MILETERLIIRENEERDLDKLHELLSDREVMYYLEFGASTRDDTRKNLNLSIEEQARGKDREKFYFTIEERGVVNYVGQIGFDIIARNESGGICDLGYFIHKRYWGMGYTTEAARSLIDYIFSSFIIHKIETGCNKDNKASERVMIKCGFRKEAELQKHKWFIDKWSDRLVYGLLREEWENREK
ncbi:MAG: GNAT family protein [Bacillota bacterium]|nr:GNAT family protein [Bacillota bacterium]